jgi:hypothetical protein
MKVLNEIIEECIQANALFTVYDVIPEAHARGCMLSHEKITDHVKTYRYPIYYARTIQDLGCEIIVPVYHPADLEASSYDSSDIMPSNPHVSTDESKAVKSTLESITNQSYALGISNRGLFNKAEDFLKELTHMIKDTGENLFTRKEAKKYTNLTDYAVIRYLKELQDMRLVQKVCGRNGSLIRYTLTQVAIPNISKQEIQEITPFDKRGRYHIRVADVQKAGFDIGDKVSIMLDTKDNTLVVTNKRQSKRLHQVGMVKVDSYQNVSISKSPFRHLKNETPIDVRVSSCKREIKIIPSY